MTHLKTLLRIAMAAFAAAQLVACSKAVQWEEEVLLNTGETIVVHRSGTYTYKARPGNPFDYGWGPDWRSTIEFTYKGKRYKHADELRLVLLAIAPDGTPNLIASPGSDWGWKHNYYCVTPYYVQLRSDHTGQNWSWPERIESWTYDLPTNLLIRLVPLDANGKKISESDRKTMNVSLTSWYQHLRAIDKTHTIEACPRRD